MKRLLAVIAHPDDEAFGPGGTLARYAGSGVEIHLLCATKGEAGENSSIKYQVSSIKENEKINIKNIRERELLKSAEILRIKKVEFLEFVDGTLCNAVYHQLAKKIRDKINRFRPQVVITNERRGISGHLDHIAVSMVATYAFLKTKVADKLYYYCLPEEIRDKRMDNYFIYFPEGYKQKEITTRVDYSKFWKRKMQAMIVHKSQWKDVAALLTRFAKWPKVDYFILQYHRGIKVNLPETDLFAGVKE
ncbi:PIG-L family deacetylase [Candidatus Gottesmanbacteria bacterium]|nr:PIG-L family deacetylase [Candidatus Gottesmanbacteria bacterium]